MRFLKYVFIQIKTHSLVIKGTEKLKETLFNRNGVCNAEVKLTEN